MVSQPEISAKRPDVPVTAVVFEEPQAVAVRQIAMRPPEEGEVLVDVEWSGISTGTEKLLWSGRMPPFPGLGYPLIPGYETVGRVAATGDNTSFQVGDRVFVSGASCYGEIRGLFGGAASSMVVSEDKLIAVGEQLEEKAVLMALAATAHHALCVDGELALPDLVVGHGVVGRLLARLTIALGGQAPHVWETNPERHAGADGYTVMTPDSDQRHDYTRIIDASGDASVIDKVMPHLDKRGEIVLAGFYAEPVSFNFPPAFMREASFRIAAEWRRSDLSSVRSLVESGAMSLDGLITHRVRASDAQTAYDTAFSDAGCLKMILDWRS